MTSHHYLLPRLRMRGPIPLFLLYVFMAWCKTQTSFAFSILSWATKSVCVKAFVMQERCYSHHGYIPVSVRGIDSSYLFLSLTLDWTTLLKSAAAQSHTLRLDNTRHQEEGTQTVTTMWQGGKREHMSWSLSYVNHLICQVTEAEVCGCPLNLHCWQNPVLWDVTSSSLADAYRCFDGTCCLLHQRVNLAVLH
jgi:hypothetical protein